MMIPASFHHDGSLTETGPKGELAHRDAIGHLSRLGPTLEHPRPGVWTFVGNGLSNATFVEAPEGLIVIDTGECVEEMAAALAAVREHTKQSVAAVIYTHFHYVAGTTALEAERSLESLPIWGHELIHTNRARAATEISASYGRGIDAQFGVNLPTSGPDASLSAGIGRSFRNPDHAPYSEGYVQANHTFSEETTATIAGLTTVFMPAPSDANDSVTIWFPELSTAVNNLVWPVLFNVFAIRGEEYRDPRVLLNGLDQLLSLDAEHLVNTHGPSLSGAQQIRDDVTRYRDAIQFLWDQTVRGLNRGLTSTELAEFVQLPEFYNDSYLTSQFYGLAEHHTRQIRTGLVGWFDEDEANLFPLPTGERNQRLIEGFGGRTEVLRQARVALAADDLRWALELATWLVRSDPNSAGVDTVNGGSAEERALLASVLRTIGQRTMSANVRNWTLTRALELEGTLNRDRFRVHRFPAALVEHGDPALFVDALRVLVLPEVAAAVSGHICFRVGETSRGLRIRNAVGVPTNGEGADVSLTMSQQTFAQVLGRKTSLVDALAAGEVTLEGDQASAAAILACFDLPTLQLVAAPC